jgi:hypothetical protein
MTGWPIAETCQKFVTIGETPDYLAYRMHSYKFILTRQPKCD